MCRSKTVIFLLTLSILTQRTLQLDFEGAIQDDMFTDLSDFPNPSNMSFILSYDFKSGPKFFGLMLDQDSGEGSSHFAPFQNFSLSISIAEQDCKRQPGPNAPDIVRAYNLELSLIILQLRFGELDRKMTLGDPDGIRNLRRRIDPEEEGRERDHSKVGVRVSYGDGVLGSKEFVVDEERRNPYPGRNSLDKYLFRTWYRSDE